MFTIIPITSCTCERVFSKLTIVKNKFKKQIIMQYNGSWTFVVIITAFHRTRNGIEDRFKCSNIYAFNNMGNTGNRWRMFL